MRRRTELMFQVAILKATSHLVLGAGGRTNGTAHQPRDRVFCARGGQSNFSVLILKSVGSGFWPRSMFDRETRVSYPCGSVTVHCFKLKVAVSNTSRIRDVPPKVALSSTRIATDLSSDFTSRTLVSRARSMRSF